MNDERKYSAFTVGFGCCLGFTVGAIAACGVLLLGVHLAVSWH